MTTRLVLALVLLARALPAAAQHAGDYIVASSAAGGGTLMVLTVDPPMSSTTIPTRIYALACTPLAGVDLCSGTDPGFDAWPVGATPVPGVTYFPLAVGTVVDVELTAIDDDTFVQLGGTTVDAAGESGRIGTQGALEGSMHLHPAWSLVVPSDTLAERQVSFRLTSPSAGYADSSVYTVTITNDPTPPTTTSTSLGGGTTTTTTTQPDPCASHAAGSAAAIGCALDAVETTLDGVNVTPSRLARRLRAKLAALGRAVDRLGTAPTPRLVTRAERARLRFSRWVERRGARLPAGIAATLLARSGELELQLSAARPSGGS